MPHAEVKHLEGCFSVGPPFPRPHSGDTFTPASSSCTATRLGARSCPRAVECRFQVLATPVQLYCGCRFHLGAYHAISKPGTIFFFFVEPPVCGSCPENGQATRARACVRLNSRLQSSPYCLGGLYCMYQFLVNHPHEALCFPRRVCAPPRADGRTRRTRLGPSLRHVRLGC